jgi:hypothetical protein
MAHDFHATDALESPVSMVLHGAQSPRTFISVCRTLLVGQTLFYGIKLWGTTPGTLTRHGQE